MRFTHAKRCQRDIGAATIQLDALNEDVNREQLTKAQRLAALVPTGVMKTALQVALETIYKLGITGRKRGS